MASLLNFRTFLLGLIFALVAILYKPVNQRLTTFGLRRPLESIPLIHGHETRIIADTQHCEDVHYHASSGYLYTACQTGDPNGRYKWFPPLGIFHDHNQAKDGGLFVIDPKTFKARQLTLQGFDQNLVTHGIDVISDISDPDHVYIFAVNHLPNPDHYLAGGKRNESEPKARSQVEIFAHRPGTGIAVHKRSVRSAKWITTPNDIAATSATGFYLTNDHHYREGLGRKIEEVLTRGSAPWSTMSFITITDLAITQPETGFYGFPIMRGLHNNNGLGHPGPIHKDELIVTDASGGVMYRLLRRSIEEGLQLVEEIQMPICLDNPSWYEDLWKTKDNDASGYILNGLARGMDLAEHVKNTSLPMPSQIYHIRANGRAAAARHADWEKRLIYSDRGAQLNSVSGAVIVGIDPATTGGKKQGWLFATGFISKNMIASRIDL